MSDARRFWLAWLLGVLAGFSAAHVIDLWPG